MTAFHLRDYQSDAIEAVFKAWSGGMKRPAMVLPTGAGKTVVFAHLIKQFRTRHYDTPLQHTGLRVMVLVHRDELADQAMAKIKAIAPELSVGKVKALDNDIKADVMVCSVQTLANSKRRRSIKNEAVSSRSGAIGLIITDECHHAAARTYQTVYADFSDALQLGVTATMVRGDGVGLGSTWEEVVYSRSVLWMIGKGYLSNVKRMDLDIGSSLALGDVKQSRGDFQVGDLGRALEESDMADKLPAAYQEHAAGRPGVVFTPTVATAQQVARSFNGAGITTAVISGDTPRGERQQIFEDYRTGRVQVLANCMVLTEGFDAPWASCAVIARPTRLPGLYTQMVGRVLRPFPGKDHALVMNVAGPGVQLATLIDLAEGVVSEVEEGELLTEAVQREEKERGSVGELSFKDVDPFAASPTAWLRTRGGNLFISCGQAVVFLWPTPGATVANLWDVAYYVKGQKAKLTEHVGLDLGSAMAWGEAKAEDFGEFSVQRSARWRQGPPSEGQQRVGDSLRIDHSKMTKGQLSDAISVALVSRVLG